MLNETAVNWLTERRIDIETADRLGLESVSRGVGDWIKVPYLRDGEVVNNKYRRLDQKEHSQDGDAVKCVWNEDCLRDETLTGPVIITEGEWDAIPAIQAGFLRSVSVPDGAPSEALGDADTAKYSYIDDLLKLLKDEKEIIVAADGDANGANLLSDLSIRLGKGRCKFLKYPKGCKDLGDAQRIYGEMGVKRTIERAQYVEMPGLRKFSDMAPLPPLNVFRARLSEDFDSHVGLCKGHLSVWTGVPGHGKSALVNAISWNMAQAFDWRIGLCGFESPPNPMGPYHRDCARYLGRKAADEVSENDMERAAVFLEKQFMFFEVDNTGKSITLDWILEHAEAAVMRGNADMIIIDPWSKLDHEHGQLSENDYTSVCLKTFQKFAKRFNVHFAVVAHPKKIDLASGKFRVPNGYDISGSAHWFNAPELGVTIHRDVDKGRNVSLVRTWKSKRHDEMGPTGDCRLRMMPSGRFEEYFEEQDSEAA